MVESVPDIWMSQAMELQLEKALESDQSWTTCGSEANAWPSDTACNDTVIEFNLNLSSWLDFNKGEAAIPESMPFRSSRPCWRMSNVTARSEMRGWRST